MNLLYKAFNKFIVSLYISKNNKCIINQCSFKGSNHFKTHGIFINDADVSIKNSKFIGHEGAGVYLNLSKDKICNIYLCTFKSNDIGVYTIGENNKSKITECKVLDNKIGIFFSMLSDMIVSKVNIKNNQYGILVLNADGSFYENMIDHNKRDGVRIISDEDMISRSKFQSNSISYNHQDGIKC